MAKRSKKKKQELSPTFNKSKLIKWLWVLVLLGILVAAALIVLVSFTKLPDTNELENPKFDQASIIYATDGPEIGRYFSKNREWVSFDELNDNLVDALVSTEDERFYSHSGIDEWGTLRALLAFGRDGGASTITQQLAKQFFTDKSKNFVIRVWQKLQEWIIALEFEKRYTKEEIIAMYLNKYHFLNDAIGISAAAQTYFGKNPNELNIQESAVMVGMLKNPRIYNPVLYPDNAQKRSEVVMKQMVRNEKLSQEKYDSIRVNRIDISKFNRQSHDKGLAPYFRMELKKWIKTLLKDSKYMKSDGGKYNLDSEGLKIYTTIDSRMQKHAEKAAQEHMKKIQKRYFQVWKHDDPWKDKKNIDISRNLRIGSLKSAVEQTDRYRKLRSRVLKKVSTDISQTIEGARLWDTDIRRMLYHKKDDKYFTKLIAKGDMNRGQREIYLQIMQSDYWAALQKSWYSLQEKAKTEFSRRTKMRVFAYNWSNEKDTVMSPLDSIKYHQMHMQLGSMAMEPQTGKVKTWVGGVGFRYFKFDHITSNRQVGSTFKPFIYTKAVMQGYSPCTQVKDQQYVISKSDPNFSVSKDWAPSNSSSFTGKEVTLFEGLKNSLNSVSVWLMKEIGSVQAVKDQAVAMGIPSEKIKEYPAICLGAADLSVLDMTSAYSCFAHKGIYTNPIFVNRIEDSNGRIIYTATSNQRHALAEPYAYVMQKMLTNAASFIQNKLEVTFGGKTGTTNDYVDGWFMGITPNLVVGTWVGGENSWIRFKSLSDGQGGQMARPFFINFMQKVESDDDLGFDSSAQFKIPDGEIGITLDCTVYDQLRADQLQTDKPTDSGDFDEDFDEHGNE